MRKCYKWIVASFVMVVPVSAGAQDVSRTDLIGVWSFSDSVRAGSTISGRGIPVLSGGKIRGRLVITKEMLTLRSDSTWTQEIVKEDSAGKSVRSPKTTSGQWYFSGDTIWLGDPAATKTDPQGRTVAAHPPMKVKFKDKGEELILDKKSYRRNETPKP